MYICWLILGIIFLYLDLKKTSSIKLVLASTFMFCAIVAFKFPQNYIIQFSSMLGFFVLFYYLITSVFKKEFKDKMNQKKVGDCIGKKAVVVKDIGKSLSIDGIGYVKYKNMFFEAKSVDDKLIKAGKRVVIVSKENKIMNVKVLSENAKK